MTGHAAPSCECDPAWPSLVAHTEAGDITVRPTATPGGLACLYQAYCTSCGMAWPARSGCHPRPRTAQLLNPPDARYQGITAHYP